MIKSALCGLVLILGGCATSPYATPVSAAKLIAEQELPAQISNIALDASGYWLCDQRQKHRQAKQFDQRYGDRVLKLAAKINQSGQIRSDVIVVTPCKIVSRSQRRAHLDAFDSALGELESAFALGKN